MLAPFLASASSSVWWDRGDVTSQGGTTGTTQATRGCRGAMPSQGLGEFPWGGPRWRLASPLSQATDRSPWASS